jgi:DNA (cytosine-5)-methyltransferase 1
MVTAIDLFAGIGGNTQGAQKAGVRVVWAGNHNRMACRYFGANNPHVTPACQDLRQADWRQLPKHWLGMASPSCKGHTKARGKEQPHHDEDRSTAWAVIDYVEHWLPEVLLVENVTEFLNWLLYPLWRAALEALGYVLNPLILDAADHGVPQHRVRLFIIANRGRHALPLQLEKQPHVPVKNIINLNQGTWSKIDRPGRALNTLRRVRNGRAEFGDVFVMPYYSNGSGLTGRSIERPLGTVTTVDRWAIVRGNEMRMVSVDEYRAAMSFDRDTKLPPTKEEAVLLLGNATCPEQITDIITAIKEAA